MAETELSVLSSQCLDRRIPDKDSLISEVAAWEATRNKRFRQISRRLLAELLFWLCCSSRGQHAEGDAACLKEATATSGGW
jgi:hypothetical protein